MYDRAPMVEVFHTEEELDGLMERIRTLHMPNNEFTHRYHLAMCACTVIGGGTLDDVRATILALNASNGVEQTSTGGYHETLTVAWHALVTSHIASLPPETPRLLAVNSVLHAFMDKSVILGYYSRDRILSWEARIGFVAPDMRPLPQSP